MPIVVLYLLVLAVVLWFILEHTPVGRYLFAVGGNPDAARLAGLNVERLTYGSLMASATIAGLAGVIFSMKVGHLQLEHGPGTAVPGAGRGVLRRLAVHPPARTSGARWWPTSRWRSA